MRYHYSLLTVHGERQKTPFSRETPVKTLDAGNAVNKKQIKASITAAIANQVVLAPISKICATSWDGFGHG